MILGIVGDIVRVKVSEEQNGDGAAPCLEDLAVVEAVDGSLSLFKNLNYSQEESPEYRELLKKIQALADAAANPKRG